MKIKLILIGVITVWFLPNSGMKQEACPAKPVLETLSIQNLIDRDELPEMVEFEFGNGELIFGYIFSQIPLTSLEGLQNLPEIKSIQVLEFEGNAIAEISAKDFEAVPNLVSLEIKDNPLRIIAPKTFDKLRHLKILKFNNLPASHLPENIFDNQHELETLDISRCQLKELPPKVFKNTEKLSILDLRHNNLTEFSPELVGHLDNLIAINLSHNKLTSISEKTILKTLATLILKGNPITYLSPKFIQTIQTTGVWTGLPEDILPIPPRTINDLIKAGIIPRVITESHFINLNLLQLTSLEGLENIENIHTVEHLSATHNYLSEIPLNLWDICPNLHTLNLANNRISVLRDRLYNQPNNEENNHYFIEIPLRNLILQSNSIERIEPDAFQHFEDLLQLNLRNNKITSLNAHALRGAFLLQDLDLSENRLSAIDDEAFNESPYLNKVDLSYNQLTRIPLFKFKNEKVELTVLLAHNFLAQVNLSNAYKDIYFIIGQQQIPELKWLTAIKIANTLARVNVSHIIKIIRSESLNADALELIFQASTNNTKKKIIEALNALNKTGQARPKK